MVLKNSLMKEIKQQHSDGTKHSLMMEIKRFHSDGSKRVSQ